MIAGDEFYGLNEDQKAFAAEWKNRGKLEFVPTPPSISAEQAHQVAMLAADTVSKSAIQTGFSPNNIGTLVAQAYLQAYAAVEGWAKPTLEDRMEDAAHDARMATAQRKAVLEQVRGSKPNSVWIP